MITPQSWLDNLKIDRIRGGGGGGGRGHAAWVHF